MKTLTLSVDEGVLLAVRRYAAKQGSTVNAMVREFLTDLAQREDQTRKARQRIRELSEHSSARLGTKRCNREELHER